MKKFFKILCLTLSFLGMFTFGACQGNNYTLRDAISDLAMFEVEDNTYIRDKGMVYFKDSKLDMSLISGTLIGLRFGFVWYGDLLYFPTVKGNSIYISSCQTNGAGVQDVILLSQDYAVGAPVSVVTRGEVLYVTHGNTLCTNGESSFRVLDSYNVVTGEVVNNIQYGTNVMGANDNIIKDSFYDKQDKFRYRVTEMVSKKQVVIDDALIMTTNLYNVLSKYDYTINDNIQIISNSKVMFSCSLDISGGGCADYIENYVIFTYDFNTEKVTYGGFISQEINYFDIGQQVKV